MFIASRFPVSFWKRIAWPALFVTVVFQLLVFTPLGFESGGNRNWILIGGMQAQPSEFLKLGLALWLGYVLFRKQTLLGLWRHVFIPLVPVSALVIGTVMAGDDLGTAMILVLIVLGALFFSGVKLRIFILPLLAAAGAVAYFAVSSPDRMRRFLSFLNPDCLADYYNDCYQPLHGIWGLAGGGVFGLGLGNSQREVRLAPRGRRATTSSPSSAKSSGSSAAPWCWRCSPSSPSAPSTSSARPTTRSCASSRAASPCGSSPRPSSTSASCCGSSRCSACRFRSCRRAARR